MNVAFVLAPSYNPDKPPLSLAYLKAYNQSDDINVRCFDLNIDLYSRVNAQDKELWKGENISVWLDKGRVDSLNFINDRIMEEWLNDIIKFKPRIVGFSIYNTNMWLTVKLAMKIRELLQDVFILFGGPEMFTYRYNFEMSHLKFINAVILGEGEGASKKIAASIKENGFIAPVPGALIKMGNCFAGEENAVLVKELDSIPFPDYGDFDLKKYKEPGQLPLIFSRGCVNKCAFCFETVFWQKFRSRSVGNIMAEIDFMIEKYNHKIFNFSLNDSLINGNFELLDEFCNTVIKRGMNIGWWGMARIDKRMDRKFITKMIKAGCRNLAYGIESGSQKVLNLMKKNYALEEMEKCIKNTAEAGIKPGISIVVGFPGEEEDDFIKTCDFVKKVGKYVSYANISSLGIIPYTSIERDKYKAGVISEDAGGWYMLDGKNSMSVRIERVNRLAEVANKYVGKAFAFKP